MSELLKLWVATHRWVPEPFHMGLSVHSGYFYSTSSSPRLLRSAPDTAWILCREFHAEAPQATASEGLVQGLYVAARVGFEPTTLFTKGDESTNEPSRPTIVRMLFAKTLLQS